MKVVIPMAGRGSRFADRGWEMPKPLIEVAGRPMILWALQSLRGLEVSEYIFILLQEHETAYQVSQVIGEQIEQPVHFVTIADLTEGQLCTVLAAKSHIDTEEPILIMASDTLVICPQLTDDIAATKEKDEQGLISVANLPGDRWSFARVNREGQVVEVAEKRRISDHASTGLYYFSSGRDLVTQGEAMIRKQEKTWGEYYVIPVYQKMINAGAKIGISPVKAMWDMGTPEAKANFEANIRIIKADIRS